MYEGEISCEIMRRLKTKFPKNYITKERVFRTRKKVFNGEYGKIDSRIDLFMINGTRFIGYEIKGSQDNPKRLIKQIERFRKYLNKLVIIIEPKHSKIVEEIVPDFCGIIEVFKFGNQWEVMTTRKAKIINEQDPKNLVRVLWKSEMVDILKSHQAHVSGANKTVLCNMILNKYSLKELKIIIRESFKLRSVEEK